MTFPIVQQNMITSIRPPDCWVFQFPAPRQEVFSVFDNGVGPAVSGGGVGKRTIYTIGISFAAKTVNTQIRPDKGRRIAERHDRVIGTLPWSGDLVGFRITGLIGGGNVEQHKFGADLHNFDIMYSSL